MSALNLSCADFTFPLLRHADALRLIAMMGFDAVDVGLFSERSHVPPETIATNPSEHGRALYEQLKSDDLVLADVFVQLGADPSQHAVSELDAAVRQADRERFRRCVEFAHAAGAKHMTGLPGVTTGNAGDVGDGLKIAADETAWRLTTAADAGLRYAIEPHVGSNCPSVAATQEFLRRVPGLTLTLDYGHFVYQEQDRHSPDVLLPHASHFHARGGAPKRLQASLAKNVIDFAPMVRTATSSSKRFVCVEYVWVDWEGCNEVDNVSESILMRQHLTELAASPE